MMARQSHQGEGLAALRNFDFSWNIETAAVVCGYVRRMIERSARVAKGDAEHGATMLEYALVATFIAVVVSTALVAFGPAVADLFTGATGAL